jgi:serine/threonine protein kinase
MNDEKLIVGKPKQDPLIGMMVAERYTILSLIGHGSTTSVYKAQDAQRNKVVVLKMLHIHSMASDLTLRRFEQECETLALLKHPNIVTHYDSGTTDQGQPFLVMEYLDGKTLKQLIDEKGFVEVVDALPIFMQACAGLAAAHERSVVHRDMKPANIMVMPDENGKFRVKLLDFGVAKILVQGETFQTKTQTGEMLGTLLYMSPEQCLDEFLDERSDVYSLGCVFYEALTGTPPLCGRTAFETMNKHLSQKPQRFANVRPDLVFPDDLERIVQKAVEKSPAQRYQKITAFEDDLRKLQSAIKTKPSLIEKPSNAAFDDDSSRLLFANADPSPMHLPTPVRNHQFLDLEPTPEPKLKDLYEDTSRQGAISFLAAESLDGIDWRRIYADTIKTYLIKEKEVLDEQKRLLSSRHNLKEMEKFALEKFGELDENSDGFVSKQELTVALEKFRSVNGTQSQPIGMIGLIRVYRPTVHLNREQEFITFMLHHLEDIRSGSPADGAPAWPKSPAGISKEDIQEYFRDFQN